MAKILYKKLREFSKKYSKNYSRTLDLQNGVATVKADNLTETVFVSYPSQLLVINIKSESGVSFCVNFDSQLHHKGSVGSF